MRVVAFGVTLVGVSVVGLGVVHKLLAYLLIDVVNGLASAICMGPMRVRLVGRVVRQIVHQYRERHGLAIVRPIHKCHFSIDDGTLLIPQH